MFMDKHLTYEFEIQIFPQIQSNVHRKLDLYHLTLNKVGKNPDVRFNTSTAIRSNTWINQSIQYKDIFVTDIKTEWLLEKTPQKTEMN